MDVLITLAVTIAILVIAIDYLIKKIMKYFDDMDNDINNLNINI